MVQQRAKVAKSQQDLALESLLPILQPLPATEPNLWELVCAFDLLFSSAFYYGKNALHRFAVFYI